MVMELGTEVTDTVMEATGPTQPLTVAKTEYVPAFMVETGLMIGVTTEEVKPLGPVQVQDAPVTVVALNNKVVPIQAGELEEMIGKAGSALMVILLVLALP